MMLTAANVTNGVCVQAPKTQSPLLRTIQVQASVHHWSPVCLTSGTLVPTCLFGCLRKSHGGGDREVLGRRWEVDRKGSDQVLSDCPGSKLLRAQGKLVTRAAAEIREMIGRWGWGRGADGWGRGVRIRNMIQRKLQRKTICSWFQKSLSIIVLFLR